MGKKRQWAVKRLLHGQVEDATDIYHWIVMTHGQLDVASIAVVAADRRIAALEKDRDDWMHKSSDINELNMQYQMEIGNLRDDLRKTAARLTQAEERVSRLTGTSGVE